MANVTRSATASVDASTAMFAHQISGLLAGEDIPSALCACYIKSDGKVWLATGTAANAAAVVRGFSAKPAKAGRAVTLFGSGTRARYSDALLTPGALFYLSATAGELADATTTGGTTAIAAAVSTTDIVIRAV